MMRMMMITIHNTDDNTVVFRAAVEAGSGLFWQDRVAVSAHLPLAWTRAGPADKEALMTKLEQLSQTFSS